MWQIYSKKSKKCEICCALIIHSGDNINVYPLLGFQSDRAGIDIDQLFMLLFLDFLQSFVQF